MWISLRRPIYCPIVYFKHTQINFFSKSEVVVLYHSNPPNKSDFVWNSGTVVEKK